MVRRATSAEGRGPRARRGRGPVSPWLSFWGNVFGVAFFSARALDRAASQGAGDPMLWIAVFFVLTNGLLLPPNLRRAKRAQKEHDEALVQGVMDE